MTHKKNDRQAGKLEVNMNVLMYRTTCQDTDSDNHSRNLYFFGHLMYVSNVPLFSSWPASKVLSPVCCELLSGYFKDAGPFLLTSGLKFSRCPSLSPSEPKSKVSQPLFPLPRTAENGRAHHLWVVPHPSPPDAPSLSISIHSGAQDERFLSWERKTSEKGGRLH